MRNESPSTRDTPTEVVARIRSLTADQLALLGTGSDPEWRCPDCGSADCVRTTTLYSGATEPTQLCASTDTGRPR
ncbi:hypothetical protein JCM4814A_48840 [Streptomyces phaeofaciens JCM 4814]|uniref:Uncharacterized protein n=1 Tax=Streptomyces phaeofaciens TaxID=68254 RepID=A0A918H3B5_9ACTN|nr:hypothetical protein GCM10010226_05500 [Streptomyces phaeofaciens]